MIPLKKRSDEIYKKKYVGENILKIKDFFNDIYRYFQINDREESES